MSPKATNTQTPSKFDDNRGMSQAIFVLAALGIISAGLWTLYMGDAPYHPADVATQSDFSMISD